MSLMRNKKIRRLLVIQRENTRDATLGLITLMSIADCLNPDNGVD